MELKAENWGKALSLQFLGNWAGSHHNWQALKKWAILMVMAGVVAIFYPILGFEFLNFDDPELLTDHPWYSPLTWQSFLAMWNPISLWSGAALDYSPVRDSSYAFDLLVWGWSGFGFHFTQLILHAVNAGLLFTLLVRRASLPFAAVGTLLWAVHPLCVEPVAWVTGRKDLLLVTGVLAAMVLWERNRTTSAIVIGVGAMLSKYTAVVLGPLYLLLQRLRGERISRKVVVVLTLFALTLGLFVVMANRQADRLLETNGAVSPWPAAFQVVVHNLRTLVWPTDLSARYVQVHDVGFGSCAIGFFLCLTWLALALWAWRKKSVWGEGWLIFGVAQVPTLLQISLGHPVWMADRYLYLPLVGASLALVAVVSRFDQNRMRAGFFLLVVMVIACGVLSRTRLPVWEDSLRLWEDTTQKSPSLYYAWGNLGSAQLERGRSSDAVISLERALKLNSTWQKGHLLLGDAYAQAGVPKKALAALEAYERKGEKKLLEKTRRRRAIVWARLGREEVAEPLFRSCLEARPTDVVAMANLGVLLARSGREKEALRQWERAIELRPRLAMARLNRARYHFREGDCGKMETDLSKFRAKSPVEKTQAKWLRQNCRRKPNLRNPPGE